MDQETKAYLDKIMEKVEDNNHILHHLRNAQRISTLTRYFYWILIIGATIGSFYYFQPYMNAIQSVYEKSLGIKLPSMDLFNFGGFNLNSVQQGIKGISNISNMLPQSATPPAAEQPAMAPVTQ